MESGILLTKETHSYNIGYDVKSIPSTVKDIDMERRMIKGYFSAFDFVDSDGDMMKKGCYSKSVKERGPRGSGRIMHLLQHRPTKPIGKITELTEDDYGLKFTSILAETQDGMDTLKLYQDGIYKEHSVGFNVIQSDYSEEDRCNVITEVKLWEGSTVTWGANEMALGGMAKASDVNLLFDRYDDLNRAYYKGTYSDDVFPIIEKQRDYIESKIKEALKNVKPSVDTSQEEAAAELKTYFKELELKQNLKEYFNE